MRNNNFLYFFAAIFLLGFTGCQTITMPSGPDVSRLELLADAPLLAVNISDSRSKEKIGSIGAAQLMVKKSDAITMTHHYLFDFLHHQGVNSVLVPEINFQQSENIRQTALRSRAEGILRFEINAFRVSSVDLLLDEPQYEVDASIIVYSAEGKLLFHDYVHGFEKSRALTASGSGKVIGQILSNALWTLELNPKFKSTLKSLKQEVPAAPQTA
jgi:hypothetical protein